MSIPAFVVWDVGYPLYTYGSIFIIALIIWQVKKRRQKLSLEPNKTCCQHHGRVKQKSRDKTSRAKKTSQEEAEKLRKLLSVMKSQGWLPQVESIRRLLCADPGCQICNSLALEIQQLLEYDNNQISPTLLGPSQGPPCPDTLSTSGVSCEQGSQDSRQFSLASGPVLSQLLGQKSLTQLAAHSADAAGVHNVWPDHLQQRQKFQAPKKPQDTGALSSSNLEEPGIPVNQKERKKNSALVPKNQGAPEADVGNTMTLFSHWINPEVKAQRHEEHISPSKAEKVTRSRTKEVKKGPAPTKDHAGGARLEKKTEDPMARPPPTEKERLSFLDVLCAF
uniref:Family with sequence similarity 205 member C n=1 Tax=Sciurus vulgaris TaxID=55149 RepID=A0A8D2DK91_SCIVU